MWSFVTGFFHLACFHCLFMLWNVSVLHFLLPNTILLHTYKVKVKSLSHVWLFATPWTVSLPGSSVHGIFQARTLEWVTISFSRRPSRPKDWTWVSHIMGRRFIIWATKEVQCTPIALIYQLMNIWIVSTFGYYESTVINIQVQVFVWTQVFISFRSETAESVTLCLT